MCVSLTGCAYLSPSDTCFRYPVRKEEAAQVLEHTGGPHFAINLIYLRQHADTQQPCSNPQQESNTVCTPKIPYPSVPHLVRRVQVRPLRDEKLHHREMTVVRSDGQRRMSILRRAPFSQHRAHRRFRVRNFHGAIWRCTHFPSDLNRLDTPRPHPHIIHNLTPLPCLTKTSRKAAMRGPAPSLTMSRASTLARAAISVCISSTLPAAAAACSCCPPLS